MQTMYTYDILDIRQRLVLFHVAAKGWISVQI